MSRQLKCPNCGGEHTLVNPGITMLVCDFCQTVVYWGEDAVLKMGRQSLLPEGDTRLFMHATGKLTGRGYEVVGHLRYDHGRGGWDEWYLQLDDGGVAWLGEDERKLSFEQFMRPDPSMPPPEQLRAGAPITLDGVGYTVREVGTATCVGGEGQLPFTVLPGEQYPYADLASHDGTRFATLEYDEGSAPRCFSGQVLDHQQLTLDEERPPSTAGAHEGKHIKCPSCAAPLSASAAGEVQTQVCAYCGAQNDLTGAEARVVGQNPKDFDPGFWFEIGQAGTFSGKRHEICGRMLYEDAEGYQTREYLLYNPEAGYLWLAEENGHFVLGRPTQQAPAYDPFRMVPKQWVKVGPSRFQFFEQGSSRLTYIDGALPWLARSGDRGTYADLIAPPQMFSVEAAESEVEYFLGRYMSGEEVYAALGLKGPAPRAYGVHPAQPQLPSLAGTLTMALGLIFAVINLGLLLWSLVASGRLILSESFTPETYLQEGLSQPFVVGDEKIMSMRIDAPLADSWLALDVVLLDVTKGLVVEEAECEISYYSGVEGGESWSEGERSTTTYFRAPPPGTYKLILKGSAGSGTSGPARGEPLTIRLYQGGVVTRYFLAAFIITFLLPFFIIARRLLFEKQRWAPVTGGDDDDDDDD